MQTEANEIGAAASRDAANPPHVNPVPRISIQAFCESPDVAAVIQAAVTDRRMNKAHVKLHMGGAPAAVEAYRSAPTPNVIVLEATHDRDTLAANLDELA